MAPFLEEDTLIHAKMCKSDDPFLYYTNDEIRLKSLKYQEVSESISLKTSDGKKSTSAPNGMMAPLK